MSGAEPGFSRFPDPRTAGPEGLVALGGDLRAATVLEAYRNGIFPWPVDGVPLMTWFSPEPRGLLFLDELHVGRTFLKVLREDPFRYTADRCFRAVIEACALVPREPVGTWITPELLAAYVELHELGHAHSFEVWRGKRLVGGIYGVDLGRYGFAAESMFRTEDHASKAGLVRLAENLQDAGVRWIDVQVMSPHVKALGGREVSREEYLRLLDESLAPARSP
ncbi:MAG: leucyl/phenylalanyl-tRNA--protein transferase [Bdellovibrionales bacterium]|nr:leucyl/phenylalanyl-tRNA--protein transferase [Bdellovibrionales bacterium]